MFLKPAHNTVCPYGWFSCHCLVLCDRLLLGCMPSLRSIPSSPFLVTRDQVTAAAHASLCSTFPELAPECPLLSIPT